MAEGSLDEELDCFAELFDGVGDLVEVLGADFYVLGEGKAEGFGGQLFLVGEVAVEAAFFEAGGGHEVLHGAAFEAALVEDGGGFGDDPLPGCFAFSHSILPRCIQHIEKRRIGRISGESDEERD